MVFSTSHLFERSHKTGELRTGLWLTTIPVLAFVAYVIGSLTGRQSPVESSILLIQAIPLLAVLGIANVRVADGWLGRFIVVLLAYQGWMVLEQVFNPYAVPCGWWRFAERSVALSLMLALLAHQISFREGITALGTACACAMVAAVVMNGYQGHLHQGDTSCYGFGHINLLVNIVTPTLAGWGVFLFVKWRRGDGADWRSLVIWGVGFLALLAQSVTTGRRGVIMALVTMMAMFGMCWLWRRSRVAVLVTVLLVTAMGGVYSYRLFDQAVPVARNERVKIYRAAMDGLIESKGLGFSHYGAIKLQQLHGENARHLTAAGSFGYHAHQELLDQGLDGGLVAIALVLLASGMTALRILRIRDSAVRAAGIAIGVGIFVHAMTDNVYGTHLGLAWLGIMIGILMCQPVNGARLSALHWLPPLRLLAWPFVLVTVWSVIRQVPPTTLSKQASPQAQLATLAQSSEPQSVMAGLSRLLINGSANLPLAERHEALRRVVAQMGWNGILAVYETALAKQERDPRAVLMGSLRVVRMSPMHRDAYQDIADALTASPELAMLVPSWAKYRMDYLRGDPSLARPDLSRVPTSIDDAADLYAQISWTISRERPWSEVDVGLRNLVTFYGDIPDVIGLIFRACNEAPPGTFPWIKDHLPAMELGFSVFLPYMVSLFSEIRTPQQAAAAYPIISYYYRDVIADCERGSLPEQASEEILPLRLAIVRIWGLQRLYRPAPLSPAIPRITPAPSP